MRTKFLVYSLILLFALPCSMHAEEVERLGRGPAPTGYQWYINGEEVNGSDSIFTHRFTSGMTSLAVRSLGMYDCPADSTQIALTFQPTPPNSIIASDTCLFSGQPIETTLSIQTPIPGQTYHWSVPQGWNIACDELDSSSVTYSASNANSGHYLISVRATGGGENCDLSDSYIYTINVRNVGYTITVTDLGKMYTFLEGNYAFSLNPSVNATWRINGVTHENISSVTSVGMPQEVIATVVIDGCEKDIIWSNGFGHASPINRSKNESKELPIIIFPNPAKDEVCINFDDDQQYQLYILDARGVLINKELIKGPTSYINISSIPTGHYFFAITDGNRKKVQNVLISH